MKQPQRYRVTAPMIGVRINDDHPAQPGPFTAWNRRDFYTGATLPDGVHPDDITHHLDLGMIEPVEA